MEEWTPFSVIVPVYNEEGHIQRCLESIITSAERTGLYEIIVVDGSSEDNTKAIVYELMKEFKQISLLDNPQKFVPQSMNLGIQHSQYELIFRVDGHATVAKDYIEQTLIAADAHPEAALIGGGIDSVATSSLGESIALALSCSFGVGNANYRLGTGDRYVDTLLFGAYRRDALNHVGGFDEEFIRNQDDELSYRLVKAGYKIFLSSKVHSNYYVRESLSKLWKQYSQYGYWKVKVIRKHKKPASIRHLVPVLFVLSLLAGIPSMFFSLKGVSLGLLWYGFILCPYMLLNFYFSLKVSLKNGISHLLKLMFIFPLLHLSYGWGFLMALLSSSKSSSAENVSETFVQSSR